MRLTADLTSAGSAGAPRASRRGGTLLLAGVAGVVALLAGCSAGQNAQTASKPPSVPGVNANVGPIQLRNLQIAYPGREHREYPKGGSAPLDVRIFNTGTESDVLVGVTSEVAERVELVGEEAETPGVCPQASVDIPHASPTGQPSSGGATMGQPDTSPGTGGSPAGPGTGSSGSPVGPESPRPARPAGSSDFSIALTPGRCALLEADKPYHLELTGLREEIQPGLAYSITFEFSNAGKVTLEVPVGLPVEGGEHSPVNIHPEEPEEAGGHHGGGKSEGNHK